MRSQRVRHDLVTEQQFKKKILELISEFTKVAGYKVNINQSYLYTCCCFVAKFSETFCSPTDYSAQELPVLHYFPQLAQTHVH